MTFDQQMIDEMIEHARVTAPDECCGIVAGKDGRATKLFRANNAEASPFRFVIDSKDQLRISNEIDDNGWELAAIYHSHTRSAAFPSQTDVNFAASWPGVVWVIVSLEQPDGPVVKAFLIENSEIREIGLTID